MEQIFLYNLIVFILFLARAGSSSLMATAGQTGSALPEVRPQAR
jgi:hypothetical protein